MIFTLGNRIAMTPMLKQILMPVEWKMQTTFQL